jgi:hypothetical protein
MTNHQEIAERNLRAGAYLARKRKAQDKRRAIIGWLAVAAAVAIYIIAELLNR